MELAKERTISVLSSDADLYRNQPLDCDHVSPYEKYIDPKSKCLEYRHAEIMKRRTHLYYVAPQETYTAKDTDLNEVVLLTQFTLDRYLEIAMLINSIHILHINFIQFIHIYNIPHPCPPHG